MGDIGMGERIVIRINQSIIVCCIDVLCVCVCVCVCVCACVCVTNL